jgi:hypothetical protein
MATKKKTAGRAKPAPAGGRNPGVESTHAVTAGEPVSYETSGHPPRSESPTYVKSRAALKQIAASVSDWYFGKGPYQDHHGGGLWVNDGQGWFFLRNLVGIEWSGQFCADPAKVDALRRNAARLYARFPESKGAFQKLGIDLEDLLTTPITDAASVSRWTDSICNASVPLPEPLHIGHVPKGGGVHNYPTPVTDIDRFRRDDFTLWVSDEQGHPAAVVPKAHLDSGERAVRVVYSTPGSRLNQKHRRQEAAGKYLELRADHPLARQAFRRVKKR